MQTVDTLLHARWIIPVTDNDPVLENHTVAIQDGKIVSILPQAQASAQFHSEQILTLNEHAIIPGLVNSHTHAAMSLFKGMADDKPLMEWLQSHIWPAEQKWVSAEFVRDGALLAIAEMLQSGTTCFNDMYFYPDITAEACIETGIRANIGLIVLDFPTIWAQHADEYIDKGLELHDNVLDQALLTTAFAPHAPYTVSDDPLRRVQALAEELDVCIHMHVHETSEEVDNSLKASGQRPLERLHDLGLLSPRMLAVHMTQLNDDDIKLVAETQTNVVHCVESNLKLASGFCPIATLHAKDINVCVGTDSNASNNDLDLLAETRTAALLAKAVANDASAMNAREALRMATINGAKALGMDAMTGSLQVGKQADMVAINLGGIASQPVYDPVSQIIYTASRDQVEYVWVNGKLLLEDRVLTTIDTEAILNKAQAWQKKISP